jgi:hypothetical protein
MIPEVIEFYLKDLEERAKISKVKATPYALMIYEVTVRVISEGIVENPQELSLLVINKVNYIMNN